LPEDQNAPKYYQNALRLCTEYLGASFGTNDKRLTQLSFLITFWMRGHSLSRLIKERVKFNKNRSEELRKTTGTIILSVLDDIEKVARFEAPKFLTCYLDILNLHIIQTNSDLAQEEMDLAMMLEMGVSRVTEVSLMALGLSRTTVVMLSEFVMEDNLTPRQCRKWLERQNLESLSLPRLVIREIRQVIDK